MEPIGQRVSRLRKERGITQVELAQHLGVSQPVISEYERGGLSVRWDQVAALARLLHVSADELVGLKPEAAPRRGPRDTRLARMLRELETLPRRDRDALVRTIDAFLLARAHHA
jgi:transcriptional regulator with XRE-family HTH domain